MRRSQRSGFTLIEVMIVVVLIGILSGLAVASLSDMTKRNNYSTATGDVVGGLRRTQQEATARGAYTAFIIDPDTNSWWGIQTDSSFSLTSFDPSSPGTVIVSGTLPTYVSFAGAGYGSQLPVPFKNIPVLSSQSPNLVYCSFCDSGTHRGSILFEPGSSKVKFSGGPAGEGQQFLIRYSGPNNASSVMAVAITERTGLVETFEK